MAEDAVFLSLIEEAEAEAFASGKAKRPRVSSAMAEEGSYMAALKGRHSSQWQQQQQQQQQQRRGAPNPYQNKKEDSKSSNWSNPSLLSSSASDGGACFKCGVSGHWAKDCTTGIGSAGGSLVGFSSKGGEEKEMPEKSCPCGSGTCLVLTSNTAKNPGRKFYRCPLRVENGGCNFFEWCDNPSASIGATRSSATYQSDPSVAELTCPCGSGLCLVLTTKTGKNVGRQYYRCPADAVNGSCGFFKWCDEQHSPGTQPPVASQKYGLNSSASSQLSGERSKSSCFKCGQEGHWAKECPNQSSDLCSDKGDTHISPSGSGTCFKCGKVGHWSRDCPAQNPATAAGNIKASNASRSQYNYRC
ncbi:uncharacterized protein [Typha angustifolia]|uniref:uncharacterized protein n=1 Tax=Typha angustifolia TaxID=59011 RepID=UPI003C2D10C2